VGVSFVSHGVRIGVRVNDDATLEQLRSKLPPGATPLASPLVDHLYSLWIGGNGASRTTRQFHLLYAGASRLARTLDLDEVFAQLESALHSKVALAAPRRLFIHAGAVGWNGRAIVIPGRGLSGTTSLTAALVQAGATYYSDAYAVLDTSGRVHPYPTPLELRGEGNGASMSRSVEELGGQAGKRPLPIGLIALTQYKARTRWRPRPLSPAQALLALLDNTVVAQQRPQFALATLGAAVPDALALRGPRGEADAIAPSLLAALREQANE
jgi:hypothetical protein